MICNDIPAPIYLFFSDSVPQLLYYSHIPTVLAALVVGILVFSKNRNTQGFSLLMLSLVFSVWVLINLVHWTSIDGSLIIFLWSLLGFIQPFIFIFAAYFIFSTIKKTDIGILSKVLLFGGVAPLIILHQSNVSGFNLPYCEALPATWFNYYFYGYQFFIFLWIVFFSVHSYKNLEQVNRKQFLLLSVGITSFLLLFFSTELFSTYLDKEGYENAFEIAQYGLFGMTFFIGVLGYTIVKYHAFNIKLIGAQALVVSLWFLVGSLLFVAKSDATRIVAGVTLLITTFAGYYLVKSVKREIGQREQIEALAENLEKANERLKILDKMKSEFVSIASHQLRSPLTSIRGYASMLVEGSYGKLPPKALEAVTNIESSSKYMALSVEDYLNVSRIEAGNMKYEMSDFNLKEVAEKIVDEMRSVAMKKGLVMVFRSDCSGSSFVHADIGKTRQVIMNLLDNSMKYTPKGTITVVAHDDVKKMKMYITIQDTGVGMSQETQSEVFDKFVRAKNANNVNVTGTGLGLFVAKKMIVAMKGAVWAESEGEGKGSTFHIELPLVPGTAKR